MVVWIIQEVDSVFLGGLAMLYATVTYVFLCAAGQQGKETLAAGKWGQMGEQKLCRQPVGSFFPTTMDVAVKINLLHIDLLLYLHFLDFWGKASKSNCVTDFCPYLYRLRAHQLGLQVLNMPFTQKPFGSR